jgi:hypothetical protein
MIKIIVTFILINILIIPACAFQTRNVIDHGIIGISFDEFLSRINHDKIVEDSGVMRVYRKGKHLLSFSDKNWLEDKIVHLVAIFSPDFKIMSGIYVGMPVQEVMNLFPDVQLEFDYAEGDSEYFAPILLQKKALDGHSGIVTLLHVSSEDGSFLGSGKDSDYPLSKFRTDGVVTSLSIFTF